MDCDIVLRKKQLSPNIQEPIQCRALFDCFYIQWILIVIKCSREAKDGGGNCVTQIGYVEQGTWLRTQGLWHCRSLFNQHFPLLLDCVNSRMKFLSWPNNLTISTSLEARPYRIYPSPRNSTCTYRLFHHTFMVIVWMNSQTNWTWHMSWGASLSQNYKCASSFDTQNALVKRNTLKVLEKC